MVLNALLSAYFQIYQEKHYMLKTVFASNLIMNTSGHVLRGRWVPMILLN